MFDGLNMGMGNLFRLSNAKTRSICPENFSGAKGAGGMCEVENGSAGSAARDLGRGWKVNPYVMIPAGETFTLAEIEGPGCIQHFWMTILHNRWRNIILRIYWDGQEFPSVECPLGDFFCCGWNEEQQISTLPVCVNPRHAFNSYWPMPFRKSCRMMLENRAEEPLQLYYQIDYTLTEVPEDAAYFHARFHRSHPLAYKTPHVILDTIHGKGHYVGTYIAWQSNSCGWWGEGEIKFYMDGDTEYPTICGTGTEDYFCGAYDFEHRDLHRYVDFTTPYAGFHVAETPDGLYRSQQRFSMYRWHVMDPIRFENDLRVTIQALGWREGGRYLPLQDDIASTAFWYQELPGEPFPPLPDKDELEVN